jgi:hypothetical protein
MITGAACGSLSSAGRGAPLWLACLARRGTHQRSATSSSKGVSNIDTATEATRKDAVWASITPACCAAWNTTKPNSPPCASKMT